MTVATAPTSAGPPEFVVAVASPPPIECPSWCTISFEEHVAALFDWEGYVLHWSRDHETAGCDFRLARTTYVDGTPAPDEPSIHVYIGSVPDCLTAEDAAEFADKLLAAITEARS